MRQRATKDTSITIRLTEDVKAAIFAAAEADERSVGSYVLRALKEHLARTVPLPRGARKIPRTALPAAG